jgi:hypothetical protein
MTSMTSMTCMHFMHHRPPRGMRRDIRAHHNLRGRLRACSCNATTSGLHTPRSFLHHQ